MNLKGIIILKDARLKSLYFCMIPFMTLLKRPRYSEGEGGMILKE